MLTLPQILKPQILKPQILKVRKLMGQAGGSDVSYGGPCDSIGPRDPGYERMVANMQENKHRIQEETNYLKDAGLILVSNELPAGELEKKIPE